MIIIKSFCLGFSIRLGSLLVSIAYLVESVGALALAAAWAGADPQATRTKIQDVTAEYKLLHVGKIMDRISHDPSPFRELAVTICCVRVLFCASAIYGTYHMKPFFLVPFLGGEFLRLSFLIFIQVTAMQILKENSQDLGLLIACTLAGSFILCFMLYCWMCVYSLYKVLRRLSSLKAKTELPAAQTRRTRDPAKDLHSYPAYLPTHSSPIAPVY